MKGLGDGLPKKLGLNSVLPKKLEEALNREPTEFQNSLDEIRTIAKDICPHCGGSGRLRAMQMATVMGGGTVRGPDTTVKCKTCNGKGRVFE